MNLVWVKKNKFRNNKSVFRKKKKTFLLLFSHKLLIKASPFMDCNPYFIYVWYEN